MTEMVKNDELIFLLFLYVFFGLHCVFENWPTIVFQTFKHTINDGGGVFIQTKIIIVLDVDDDDDDDF